ncbi:ectoine hydroxylase [Chitinolyticbacter meiyuanensis]|uniref:ectoine hydroxylase n=1 Tax=Chitinolyticbacter meiyuanensis TaxID=682798 RepID=UPI0011E5A0EF|nr:ectoine hydroxylase [Chitinolyticbacter meiyuanensis]
MMFKVSESYPSRGNEAAILSRVEPVVPNPTYPGPLSPRQLDQFEQDGFLFLPDLFAADEVQALYEEMQRVRDDFAGANRPEAITERGSGAVRSVFNVHRSNAVFSALARHPCLLGIAQQIVGGEVYIHQSRINYKPGLVGREFFWHSDFETWHVEDGMPAMRAVSCAIALTENTPHNGPLMLIPGSHRYFIACAGHTPSDHYQQSLKKQEYGVPDAASLEFLTRAGAGIAMPTGGPGSVVFFDCNTMHGSNSNISPLPRSNVFMVYNHIDNALGSPKYGLAPRPEYIAAREQCVALTVV